MNGSPMDSDLMYGSSSRMEPASEGRNSSALSSISFKTSSSFGDEIRALAHQPPEELLYLASAQGMDFHNRRYCNWKPLVCQSFLLNLKNLISRAKRQGVAREACSIPKSRAYRKKATPTTVPYFAPARSRAFPNSSSDFRSFIFLQDFSAVFLALGIELMNIFSGLYPALLQLFLCPDKLFRFPPLSSRSTA